MGPMTPGWRARAATGPSCDTCPPNSLSANAIAALEGTHPARSVLLAAGWLCKVRCTYTGILGRPGCSPLRWRSGHAVSWLGGWRLAGTLHDRADLHVPGCRHSRVGLLCHPYGLCRVIGEHDPDREDVVILVQCEGGRRRPGPRVTLAHCLTTCAISLFWLDSGMHWAGSRFPKLPHLPQTSLTSLEVKTSPEPPVGIEPRPVRYECAEHRLAATRYRM